MIIFTRDVKQELAAFLEHRLSRYMYPSADQILDLIAEFEATEPWARREFVHQAKIVAEDDGA
jgi:hypothetical protein